MAILIPIFLFLFGFPLIALISVGIDHGVDAKDVIACGVFGTGFFLFLYAEIVFVRLLFRPNSLVVSREGLSITKLGKTTCYLWRQLGDPVKKYVSSGKGGSFYISLSQASGKSLLVPGESYTESFDDVLAVLKSAKAGNDLVQPIKSNLNSFTQFAIPATLVAALLFYGTVARFIWVINSVHR